ncbi:sensor histidine kinase [Sinanaerobacter chloroacetimidivorans]|uniref:histidine kinase n=1 Tax=Sinanaerobacter chloroacetimidivorans TaxID=2818044 RepID=A0A8J8B1B2_9FIRM|nr:PAS domain-containing sensor histidine kinase [Sinanaerobacter chloroacetimidivorans]MBR0597476.1 PAS domain-containing sensor histidine kinase [Sinanaerobacter chloroacetimidivorans]
MKNSDFNVIKNKTSADKIGNTADPVIRQKLKDVQAINQQIQGLKRIVASISDGLIILSKYNKFYFLNQAGKDFFYRPETIKFNGDGFVHTKYYNMQEKQLTVDEMIGSRVLKGEVIKNERIKAVRPDKTLYYSMSGNPVYDENHQVLMAVICARDITEAIENDNLIKEQKKQLEAIFENISDAICLFDQNDQVIVNNEARRHLFPHGVEAGARDQNYKFLDAEKRPLPLEEYPLSCIKRKEAFKNKVFRLDEGGKIKYIHASGTPILDQDGNFEKGVLSLRDITENIQIYEKYAEQQDQLLKIEKEKNEALESSMKLKDEFLYLITHEFRTPMAVINSALQAIDLLYSDEVSEKIAKYLNTIKQNTNRQLRLVNNLLDNIRISSGLTKLNYSIVDIVYVTRQIVKSVELFSRQKKVDLRFCSKIPEKLVLLDEEKYERILLNLLSNALKFTPKGKKITVILAVKKRNKKNMICVSVRDAGIGIPKDMQQVIFERFGQVDSSLSRKAEGTGLGLHLVKQIVEVLEGELILESKEGTGSTFTVFLPIIKILDHDKVQQNHQTAQGDNNRIDQAVSIEFSDIYYDK